MQMYSTNQMPTSKTMLCYGPTGCGKTRLIATCQNPFIASTDMGLVSLRRYNLPYTGIRTHQDFKAFMTWLKTPQAKQFSHICIDDMTELADIILQEERKKTTNLQRAYGIMADTVLQYCRDLRDLGTQHLIYMIAKCRKTEDPMTGGIHNAPMFPGKVITPMIPYLFDEVYYLHSTTNSESGAFENFFLTRRNDQFEAKTRSDSLDQWEPANLDYIFKKISQQ